MSFLGSFLGSFSSVRRSFVVIFLFAFFGAGALLISYVIFPCIAIFEKKEKKKQSYSSVIHKTWRFFIQLMEKAGSIKVLLENPEKLETETQQNTKGKIIVANHPSFIDIVLLIGLMPNTICIAKKELKKNFFMGNIVKSLYLINDQDNEKLLKDAVEVLNNGFNIVIFPTGTRTLEGEELKLHKGASMMALHAKADILPVYISCNYRFLAKNQKIYDAGKKPVQYTITVNELIKIDDFAKQNPNLTKIQLRNRVNKVIKEKISTAQN